MKPEEKRTFEVNPAVSVNLRGPAEVVQQQPPAARPTASQHRAPTFTPALVWRIIEKMREL